MNHNDVKMYENALKEGREKELNTKPSISKKVIDFFDNIKVSDMTSQQSFSEGKLHLEIAKSHIQEAAKFFDRVQDKNIHLMIGSTIDYSLQILKYYFSEHEKSKK